MRNNFVLVYELLDETMDHGYPQITAVNILSSYIKEGTVNPAQMLDGQDEETITSQITGAVDWRQPGILAHALVKILCSSCLAPILRANPNYPDTYRQVQVQKE